MLDEMLTAEKSFELKISKKKIIKFFIYTLPPILTIKLAINHNISKKFF